MRERLQYDFTVGIRDLDHNFYRDVQQSFQGKRDRFCQVLGQLGLAPTIPHGAHYVFADGSRLPGATGKDRAIYVLEKTGVAGVPGEAFFQEDRGRQFVRFSFAKTDADLKEACERLKKLV